LHNIYYFFDLLLFYTILSSHVPNAIVCQIVMEKSVMLNLFQHLSGHGYLWVFLRSFSSCHCEEERVEDSDDVAISKDMQPTFLRDCRATLAMTQSKTHRHSSVFYTKSLVLVPDSYFLTLLRRRGEIVRNFRTVSALYFALQASGSTLQYTEKPAKIQI